MRGRKMVSGLKSVRERDKKLNLFGIFRPDNFCVSYECPKNITSDCLIAAIADYCRYLKQPTVLVLDNAPTHCSYKFRAAIERWAEMDLYVFFLPRYCPHLNKAETFWRKAKYEWLKPSDYASFKKYKRRVYQIFDLIGTQYQIKFKEMMV